MLNSDELYFEWLTNFIANSSTKVQYRKLFKKLFFTKFYWLDNVPRDENRAIDGQNLQERYKAETHTYYISKPCSVLEMLIALSIRCEIEIMSDFDIGNRTGEWFWEMISNLDLISMTSDFYDDDYVDFIISRFLNREYSRNGEGGLFTISGSTDMRQLEIWYQLNAYLNEHFKGE